MTEKQETTVLTELQIRELFKVMHARGSSTNNVASAGRLNTAEPFNDEKFIEQFDEMLDENFEIAKSVYEKFGA